MGAYVTMMNQRNLVFLSPLFLSIIGASCFSPALNSQGNNRIKNVDQSLNMGIFDDLKLIFSDEGKKNRAEYDERLKDEQQAEQRKMLMRRADPEAMVDYRKDVNKRRKKLTEDREVWDFQQDKEKDPIEAWTTLRKEGKIQVGSDLERDPGSSRLGSEGLIGVRIDERMPYIDQGYVEEKEEGEKGSIMDIFGKKDEKSE